MNKQQQDAMERAVQIIARRYLNLQTLEPTGNDAVDFKEQASWSVRAALEAAFSAGMVTGMGSSLKK
jgi:hypothetical protein